LSNYYQRTDQDLFRYNYHYVITEHVSIVAKSGWKIIVRLYNKKIPHHRHGIFLLTFHQLFIYL